MASGYSVFVTYQFENAAYSGATGTSGSYGHSDYIHCTKYGTLTTESLAGKAVSTYFTDDSNLKFLLSSGSTNGTGFTATAFKILVQVVNEISDETVTVVPDSDAWFVVDVTDQIPNHTVGDVIYRENLVDALYQVEFVDLVTPYTLSYLNYPTQVQSDDLMGFGEESVFFGTVRTDIKATVYTSDISISLPASQFNFSTNPTWDGSSPVAISEIGIYDENDNLVAIGKLNFPIDKSSLISRSIAFNLDF